MGDYVKDLITRGDIGKLCCPHHTGCKTFLTEFNLKSLGVDPELIEKCTTFSFNQAIEAMEDFGWCPNAQCNSPAEIDRPKNFGQCTQCRLQFCLTCKDRYHFFKRCPALKVNITNEEKHKVKPMQVEE
jgi:hypothetical protein